MYILVPIRKPRIRSNSVPYSQCLDPQPTAVGGSMCLQLMWPVYAAMPLQSQVTQPCRKFVDHALAQHDAYSPR